QGARRLRRLAPSRSGFAEPRRSGNRGGELDRVDEQAGRGLEAEGVAFGALVGSQLLQAGARDLNRVAIFAVDGDKDASLSICGRVGAPGLVLELERRDAFGARP